MAKSPLVNILEKGYLMALLEEDRRIDGRKPLEFRELKIETDYITKADGSAFLTLGNTKVVAGIKLIPGNPYPDTPNNGAMIVSVERGPLASPLFEGGPPREAAIELARVTDRGIRESKAIDTASLCIVPGKKVWIVFVDVYVLNADGNLFDACSLAAIAALLTAKMRKWTYDEETDELTILDERMPIQLDHVPISVTMTKIDKHVIVDPIAKEDHIKDVRVTFAFTEEDKIVSAQKGENGTLTPDEVIEFSRKGLEVSKTLRQTFMDAVEKK